MVVYLFLFTFNILLVHKAKRLSLIRHVIIHYTWTCEIGLSWACGHIIGVLYQIACLNSPESSHTCDCQGTNIGYINIHGSVMSYHQKPYCHRRILNMFDGIRFPELPAAEVGLNTCTFTLSGYKCLVAAVKSLPIRHKIQIIFFWSFWIIRLILINLKIDIRRSWC